MDPSVLLSKELRRELRGDCAAADLDDDDNDEESDMPPLYTVPSEALVLPSRRKREKAEAGPSQEVVEEVKRLSKKARKKLAQIAEKKEKSDKKASYYEVLKAHELTQEHRNLLVSSKEIGQQHTLKNSLKRVFKKYKSGIQLTREEEELLFPTGTADGEEPDIVLTEFAFNKYFNKDVHSIDSAAAAAREEMSGTEAANNDADCSGDLMMDISALCSFGKEAGSPPQHVKKKKSKKGSSEPEPEQQVAVTSSVAASVSVPGSAAASSLGLSLMEQLQALKAKSIAAPVTSAPAVQAPAEVGFEGCVDHHAVPERPKIRAVTMQMPFDERGNVRAAATTATAAGESAPAAVARGTIESRRAVAIERRQDIQAARMLLPVYAMEQEIVELVSNNDAIILCGETGSGKSTQIPQFLYEAGYGRSGLVGITQPRRVAATSTAQRVAMEMNTHCSSENGGGVVGYQIRFDASTVGDSTCIKFMTDGILLREITADLLLRKYSVVILDEAHERNVNTDVLIGMLSRTVRLRRVQAQEERAAWQVLPEDQRPLFAEPLLPLKVVVMSATLRVNDFTSPSLFSPVPPVINVEARQYPVTVHFARRTEQNNYLEEVYRKVCQIHRKLPDGGVLVFLTGKQEILHMCRKLNRALNKSSLKRSQSGDSAGSSHGKAQEEDDDEVHRFERTGGRDDDEADDDSAADGDLSDGDDGLEDGDDGDDDGIEGDAVPEELGEGGAAGSALREAMLREALGLPKIIKVAAAPEGEEQDGGPAERPHGALILPLYAMMPQQLQGRVFLPPPVGKRLIVIATNVAETSITIPGVKYVVDSGRQKEKVQSLASGISKFEVRWVSKAAAEQRTGRAGRTGPGHCYRLYSSAFYDRELRMFMEPEISSVPLEDLVLQMRSLGIAEIEKFPFPTPPPRSALRRANSLLANLGAVKATLSAVPPNLTLKIAPGAGSAATDTMALTDLGRLLARFSINPRYAKMLVVAHRASALAHALSLVAILAERSPFISGGLAGSLSVGDNEEDEDDDDDDRTTNASSSVVVGEDHLSSTPRVRLSYHPEGDALAMLRSMGAYAFAVIDAEVRGGKGGKNSVERTARLAAFCNEHNLNQTTLERASELRQQLSRSCVRALNEEEGSGTSNDAEKGAVLLLARGAASPPSRKEELALRQVLLTGFVDCIARRVPAGVIQSGSRRKKTTAYYSCDPAVTEPLYIHPQSCLYRKDPSASHPEFVVYQSLLLNQAGDTTYMTCVTEVSGSWIATLCEDSPLLHWTPPLSSPSPYYDAQHDEVLCYSIPAFGAHKWDLPPVKRPLQDCIERTLLPPLERPVAGPPVGYRQQDEACRWFMRLLLEGSIELPGLRIQRDLLREAPQAITQKKPDDKVARLLAAAAADGVVSRRTLLAAAAARPGVLCEELAAMFVVDARRAFRVQWAVVVGAPHSISS